ncbi:MAG: pyrroloquinoline quinone-dependent dehydrogenase [Bryobacteraceae bacterium]
MRPAAVLFFTAALVLAQENATRENWPHYGGQYSSWRYSALDQVNRSNAAKLIPKWVFQTGVNEGGLQATPIVLDGVMYVSTSYNRVFAIDAETGREIWHYFYPNPKEIGVIYSPWNRGVAVAQGRVYMGTLDNHVVALDQKTGREVWNVEVEPLKTCGCNITGAPLVVKDKVVVGVTGGDSAHRGYITAYHVKTGRLAWRFWTIPGPGEPGHDTWEGDSWKFGGGASWMTGSYDAALNLIYWSVGNPAADFYGGSRKGRNLYTDSVVALDADSGKLKWYYQQIPHDVWDFDTAYENVLVDLPVKGQARKLLLNVNKSGYTFVNDRVTGEFVAAWTPVKNVNWIKGIDENGNLVGRNEPPVGVPVTLCPSIGGGRSWNHAAYSPRTKLFYSTGIEWCQEVTARVEEPSPGREFFGGVFKLKPTPSNDQGGHLGAYDPVTGSQTWRYNYKYPLLASVLATAGDVVFTGDAEGQFFALDALTGRKLWSFQTGSGHRGSSVAYSVKGKQYIATPSGWGSAVAGLLPQLWPETEAFRSGSAVFAFALPEN